jgi:hypothetical protein
MGEPHREVQVLAEAQLRDLRAHARQDLGHAAVQIVGPAAVRLLRHLLDRLVRDVDRVLEAPHPLERALGALQLRQLLRVLDVVPAPRFFHLQPQVGALALDVVQIVAVLPRLDLDLRLRARGHRRRGRRPLRALRHQQLELTAQLDQRLLRQQPALGLRNQLLGERDVA